MRITRQEIQIAGAAVIFCAAGLFAFSDYPLVEQINESLRQAIKLSPAIVVGGLGLLMLLVPIAIPGIQRIVQSKTLPQLVVAPEDSPRLWRRAQGELRGLFYALVVLLGVIWVVLVVLMPNSRLVERSKAHTRIVGAIRNAARVAAFSFPAGDPSAGWRPFAPIAEGQINRDSLRDAPALAVLCRLLRSSPRALMQEVERLPPLTGTNPRAFADSAWRTSGKLRPEDIADLAHVYLLLGRFMATQSEDGRFVFHVEKARAFLSMAAALGIEHGVVNNGLAVCDIAMFVRPVAQTPTTRSAGGWSQVDAKVDWIVGWKALRRLETAEAEARDIALRERIRNNRLYLDMRMCQACLLYELEPPDSGVFQFEAERVHRLRGATYLDSLIRESSMLATRATPDGTIYATTWCQGLMLRSALLAKAAGSGGSSRASRGAFATAVRAIESDRLAGLRGELGRHLESPAEAERYFFGAFSRCDPSGEVRRRLASEFRGD